MTFADLVVIDWIWRTGLSRAAMTSRQSSATKALRRVVTNTTPLIALAQCNLFPLLQALIDLVLIPPAAYREMRCEGDGRTGAEETQAAVATGWLVIQALQEPADARRLQQAFLLSDGESAALALARQSLLT